jgi:hypothetical protein
MTRIWVQAWRRHSLIAVRERELERFLQPRFDQLVKEQQD